MKAELMPEKEATIFVERRGHDPSSEFKWVVEWLRQNASAVRVVTYISGGWEHIWDVYGEDEIISQIPPNLLSSSLNYPKGWTAFGRQLRSGNVPAGETK